MISIALKGYYGYGNFGDDILCLTSYHYLKSLFPNAQITILTLSRNANYLNELLGEKVLIDSSFTNKNYSILFLGGGGVFFDFKNGSLKDEIINRIIYFCGANVFTKLYCKVKKTQIQGKVSLAVGVGIGTFTKNSVKLRNSIIQLSRLNKIYLRDKESLNNLESLVKSKNACLTTDLAFATQYWFPNNLHFQVSDNPSNIGFIVRAWSSEIDNIIIDCTHQLSKTYNIKIFFLEEYSDSLLIERLTDHGNVVVWNPENISMTEFLQEMQSCQLHITQRAHGGIVSALLGRPFIALEIEPKLAQIHQMFKNSSVLVSSISIATIENSLSESLKIIDKLSEKISIDIESNQNLINSSLDEIALFLKKGCTEND